jgi:branched-chain amino acid transport system substrate-binding protein
VTIRRIGLAAGAVALALVGAACSSSSKSSGGTTTTAASSGTTAAPTTTAAAGSTTSAAGETTTTSGSGEVDQTALDYVGVKAKATASGTPVTIGYVNQESLFPEATFGTKVGVDYVNSTLGGVDGHPLALKVCDVEKEEDGQACAQQMLADSSISVVLTGTLTVGNAPLLSTLAGKKPVVIGSPVTTPDFIASDAYAYTPGSPGVIQGMAIFAAKYLPAGKPNKVAIVYSSNDAGKAAYNALTVPVLKKLGITNITGVEVSDTAGPQDFASAIQAAGAADAQVFIPLVTIQGCIGTYDAMKSLGIKTPVVTTGLCFGTPMTDHLKQTGQTGDVPDSWYFGGYGYSYFIPGYPANDNYIAVVHQYADRNGIKDPQYTGFAGPQYGNILTIAKFINTIGAANLSPDTFRTTAKAFTGPMWGVVGAMSCGSNPIFKSLCGTEMGIQQYTGGKWVSVRDGYNNMAIDPTKELAAS